MISHTHRLRTREVAWVLKHGHGLPPGTYLSAKVFHPVREANGTMRSAVVASKKIAKTNVVRNRVRRAAYDSIRIAITGRQLTMRSKPTHIVFFVRSVPESDLRLFFVKDIKKILSALS